MLLSEAAKVWWGAVEFGVCPAGLVCLGMPQFSLCRIGTFTLRHWRNLAGNLFFILQELTAKSLLWVSAETVDSGTCWNFKSTETSQVELNAFCIRWWSWARCGMLWLELALLPMGLCTQILQLVFLLWGPLRGRAQLEKADCWEEHIWGESQAPSTHPRLLMSAALRFPLPVSWAASAAVLSLPCQAVHFHVVRKHKCFSFQLFSCSHEKSVSAKQPGFPFLLPHSFPFVSFLPLLPHTLIMAMQVEVVHWLRLRLVNTKKNKNKTKYGRKIKMINTTDYISLYLKTKGKMNAFIPASTFP